MKLLLSLIATTIVLLPPVARASPECGTVMTTTHAQVTSGAIVWVGEPPPDVQAAAVEEAIIHAVDQWNSVGCSTASLTYEGRLESTDQVDDEIPLLFATPGEVPCFPEGFLGFTVFACDGIQVPTVYLNDTEFEWVPNPDPFQDTSNLKVDLKSAITHELGHVLGLSHLEHPLATMVANYLVDGGQASVAADDKWALCEITPGGGDECSDQSDCEGFGTCTAGSDFKVCNEERGSFGDYCSVAFQICDEFCLVSDTEQGVGYCSRACASNSDCPDDYACAEFGSTSRCELESFFEEDSGCTAAGGKSSWLALFVLLVIFTSRRAHSGSYGSLCRVGRASRR